MPFLRLLPAILALLLIGAHGYRAGWDLLVPACLVAIGLLWLRERWVPRLVQVVLVLAALEWVRTLFVLAAERAAEGRPALRLAIILGAVAAVTLAAAWPLATRRVREWYAGGDAGVPAARVP